MRSSVFLALVSGLLTYASTTTLNTSLNAVNTTLQWTPNLPYPTGYSAATCPLGPRPNLFSTLKVPEQKERSLITATHLRRRNEICRQIMYGKIEHFSYRLYQTEEVLLVAGITYVFSWATTAAWAPTTAINEVEALRHNHDGTFTIIQRTNFNEGRGTMTLNIDQTAPVRFIIIFNYGVLGLSTWGEFALFQIGPG